MANFQNTAVAGLPPEGALVETMDSEGTVTNMVFKNGLWWLSDMSMYVYYTPTFWRAL